jgi:hypothetical protein
MGLMALACMKTQSFALRNPAFFVSRAPLVAAQVYYQRIVR